MAITEIHTPDRLDPAMLDLEAFEIEYKSPDIDEAVERAWRWSALVAEHPPPQGCNEITRRVWAALLDAGIPMTTQQLATMLHRHRGNIDRALTTLREAGLIYSGKAWHHAVPQNCRRS